MPKICQTCGKYPVFSKGLCKYCYLKANSLKQIKKTYKYTQAKQKAIKTVSDKRKTQLKLYEQAKKEKIAELKAEGKWFCFFSGLPFPDDFIPDCHHTNKRQEGMVFDKRYMVFCYREYHTSYHNLAYGDLSTCRWYISFMERLKEIDIELYNKELKKGTK